MILQSLYDYYQRKIDEGDPDIAPFGFEQKEIPFVIEIDKQGELIQIENARIPEGKRFIVKPELVPQGVKKSSGITTNLFWDNAEYVLGLTTGKKEELARKEQEKALASLEEKDSILDGTKPLLEQLETTIIAVEASDVIEEKNKLSLIKSLQKQIKLLNRVTEQHTAFVEKLNEQDQQLLDDEGVTAVKLFLETFDVSQLENEPLLSDLKTNPNITFRLQGDKYLVCQRKTVISSIQAQANKQGASKGTCLISGEQSEIERLHTAIKGVWGAQTAGANIISFNLGAFNSYGKKQGENAPVGQQAMFAYTTAINHLLRKDSTQRVQVGDTSTIFWTEKKTLLETLIPSFFSEAPKDEPDKGTNAVKSLYQSIHHGQLSADEKEIKFHVLGLAPNAARIAIRFWETSTVKNMSGRLVQHFDDISINHSPKQLPHLPLFRLLVSTATLGKADNIPPNIAGETIRSILTGMPYPQTLLAAAIRRNRAEQEVTYPRAAIIKACINRQIRYKKPEIKEELKVSLDKENPNTGYRLGRLFAVLEKIQEEASPGINATIRDRYYGAAASTPVTVFSTLLKLKNHHVSKMSNKGRVTNMEKLIGEIMSEINDFPANLVLADQGRFSIGYYHQRQDFFKKRTTENEIIETPETGVEA